MILLSLELKSSLRLLQKRKELFLCTKEIKGEVHLYLEFMGRTNWGIKNANRVAWISYLIPGLQGVAANAEKVRDLLKHLQTMKLASYLKTLASLRQKGCSLDPRMAITPFELSTFGYARDVEGRAKLREVKWNYYFIRRPYAIALEVRAMDFEAISPRISYLSSEKGVTLHSLSSSR